jgi:hypothetical protein
LDRLRQKLVKESQRIEDVADYWRIENRPDQIERSESLEKSLVTSMSCPDKLPPISMAISDRLHHVPLAAGC